MASLSASRRIREVWDQKLRESERELLCSLAGLESSCAEWDWGMFPESAVRRLTIAFRCAAELGDVARYALNYPRGRA